MESPHEDLTQKWGSIGAMIAAGAASVYHFVRAIRSPRAHWRESGRQVADKLDIIEAREIDGESIHVRDEREFRRLVRRMLSDAGIK